MMTIAGNAVAGGLLGDKFGRKRIIWFSVLGSLPFTLALPFADDEPGLGVSRGGTASWYRDIARGYADVFSQVTPETFRAQHDARVRELGEQKQTRVTGDISIGQWNQNAAFYPYTINSTVLTATGVRADSLAALAGERLN